MKLPKKHAEKIASLINTIRVWDAIAAKDHSEQAFKAVNESVRGLREYGIDAVPYTNPITGEEY